MIAEGPSADDGDMLHDVDARQPVDPESGASILGIEFEYSRGPTLVFVAIGLLHTKVSSVHLQMVITSMCKRLSRKEQRCAASSSMTFRYLPSLPTSTMSIKKNEPQF